MEKHLPFIFRPKITPMNSELFEEECRELDQTPGLVQISFLSPFD